MNVVHGLSQSINSQPTVLTIGVFDGVHRGHQHLISSAVARAGVLGFQSAVLTFDPHPDFVLHPDRGRLYLSSLERRATLIAALGVDVLVVLPFGTETTALSAAMFVDQICTALPLRELWVGYDFALGRRREGDLARLGELGRERGFTVHPVEPLLIEGGPVSSSRIRAALGEGDVVLAERLLGRFFSVEGVVVEGDKRGRTIGFPTANVAFDNQLTLPADGVYVCEVEVGDTHHRAVTNVGVRPTFDGVRRTVEAHLLDFNGDLYGQHIGVTFRQRLRGEKKFNGIGELIEQITRDAQAAREYIAEGRTPDPLSQALSPREREPDAPSPGGRGLG